MTHRRKEWIIGAVLFCMMGLARDVSAQVPGAPDTYGISSDIGYNLGPDDFSALAGTWLNEFLVFNSHVRPTELFSTLSVAGPVHLPAGALVTSITVFYHDTHPSSDPVVSLQASNTTGNISILHTVPIPGFAAGDNSVTSVLPTPVQIDNAANHYSILVSLSRGTAPELQALYRVRVTYRLQVSPAPGTATFADVPVGHPFHRFVEALVASGITAGCGSGNYCPNDAITRGQMAVFLAAALGLHWPN